MRQATCSYSRPQAPSRPLPIGMYPVEWSMTSMGIPRRLAARAAQTLWVYMRVCTTQKSSFCTQICAVSAWKRAPGLMTGKRPFMTGQTGRR